MSLLAFMVLLLAGSAITAFVAWRRARKILREAVSTDGRAQATAGYHTLFVVLLGATPPLLVLLLWMVGQNTLLEANLDSRFLAALSPLSDLEREAIMNFVSGKSEVLPQTATAASTSMAAMIATAQQEWLEANGFWTLIVRLSAILLCIICGGVGLNMLSPRLASRHIVERLVQVLLLACSAIAIAITIGIILSLVFEAFRFFAKIPVFDFLFGLEWSPQIAMRADQVGASGSFGAVPVFLGTLLISVIAIAIAGPLGILSAVCLSEYANRRSRAVLKPIIELLAGVPTVVYGFFAALTVAPLIRATGEGFGLEVSSESALAAGLVMGIMITPLVSSLSDDVINAVPQALRQGAWGLGATHSETVVKVVLPAALPGVAAAILLATSRAIGETMIVVMAAGLAANLTLNPLDSTTTVTTQITTLLVGDQEFNSPKTLAAFALGLTLFLITFCMNAFATRIVAKYREIYD